MPNEGYIWTAYVLTWLVVIPFTWATLRRVRRAERAAGAGESRTSP
jgi:heme exporter protein D